MDKVCTVIVTYNGGQWIQKCLDHLLASSIPSEIIVVDNFSTDETLSVLDLYSSKIILIKSAKNLGFGGGNNKGIKEALQRKASYIFLLNQDAYVESNCIESLVHSLKKYPGFGIMSPLQLNSSATGLDHAFKKYVSKYIPQGQENYLSAFRKQESNCVPLTVRFANAAAWMLPYEALSQVGYFHPAFIHYGEDNHYSSRMQYHGYKIGIDCNAAVVHDRQEATGEPDKLLLRKLRTVPLYTLLDIRKPFVLAWLSGFLKLNRLKSKLAAINRIALNDNYPEQKKWFTVNLKKAAAIRKETKQKNNIASA
jgi:GT2 family glycosyltransferase